MNTALITEIQDIYRELSSDEHEHSAAWDEIGLTVQDAPFDLASEIEPTMWDRFMPNDGTPAIEHRLRRQGLRKFDDSKREPIQELVIEMAVERRTVRVHIIRQAGGEHIINQSELGAYDRMRLAMLEADIAHDIAQKRYV